MTSTASAGAPKPPPATCTPPWLRALTWLMCALALTSCAAGIKRTPVPTPIPAPLLALLTPIPPVDQSLTGLCQDLPPAEDDRATALIENHVEVAARYHACASRQAGLSRASRERERLEAERIERARAALQGMRP